MGLRRATLIALLGLALVATGCGGEDEGGELAAGGTAKAAGSGGAGAGEELPADLGAGESYAEMVVNLREAAAAGKAYHAAQRARKLDGPQKHTLRQFCHFIWQIKVNFEEERLGDRTYIVERLVRFSAYPTWATTAFTNQVRAAVKQLDEEIGLASIRPSDLDPYLKACYR